MPLIHLRLNHHLSHIPQQISSSLFLNPSCFSSPTCLLSHVHYPHMQQHLITHAHASLVRTRKHGMLTKLISILALAGTAATYTLTLAAALSGHRRHLLLLGRTCPSLATTRSTVRPDALPHPHRQTPVPSPAFARPRRQRRQAQCRTWPHLLGRSSNPGL